DALEALAADILCDEFSTRLQIARKWLQGGESVSDGTLVEQLGNGVAAHNSCVTAVYLALRFRNLPFMDMQRFIVGCGGDVDTIGAMAGGIWGAANGYSRLPANKLVKLEQFDKLLELATALYHKMEQQAAIS